MRLKLNGFHLLLALLLILPMPSNADVPAPPAPPPVPAGYCSTIATELQGYLDNFNQTLGTPDPYPTLQIAQLQIADSNAGPGIASPNFLASVMIQVQELKAMGFQGVKVEVAFPVLYAPFFGGTAAMQPYLDFYTGLAQNLKAMGMKLVVEFNSTLSTGDEVGWTNVNGFYDTLNWSQFMAARATMAGTIAQSMQPDFLMLSNEPDNEAANTGQTNLNDPNMAAAMIAAEITAARAVSPSTKLGAGFGTWMGPYPPNGLTDYLNAYVALPLDYIDMHIYPINDEYNGLSNLLNNALIIANGATAASKPVAISESWPWKMEDKEFNVVTPDVLRGRNPFGFWAPIDSYFIQTMEKLANYTRMLYLTTQGNVYFQASQTYGGTTENGGAANCTCTTSSCTSGDITALENKLSMNAGQVANFTPTAFAYNALLVPTPDTVAPSAPTNLAGNAGYTSASISWTGSTDDVGVAAYNIYRCTPPPCTGAWIANSAATSYFDSGLNDNTPYQYEVEAFDMANNKSLRSNTLNLTTALNTPPNAPINVLATPVSPKQITVTWSPPQDTTGLTKYLIFAGTSSNLAQIAIVPSTATSFQDQPLSPATTYCYGVVAVEQGLNSSMSQVVCATTLPLPNPPSAVTATLVYPTKITLTWQETSAPGGLPIANYQVYRGTVPGLLFKVATVLSNTYTSTSLTPGTTYYFEIVAADNAYDNSVPSDPIAVRTPPMPPAPTNVQASAPAANKLTLTWQWAAAPGGLPIARYNVYCGTSITGQPKTGTVTSTTYSYTTASPGTRYYCYVVAVDSANDNSPASSTVSIATPPMPPAPTNVQPTTPSATKVTVSWQWAPAPGGLPAARYNVYCGISTTNQPKVGTTTITSFTYLGAYPATQYYCYVVAVDTGNDNSQASATVAVKTPPMPNAPTNVQGSAVTSTKITVTWSETIPPGGLPISSYKIYRSTTLPVTTANFVATRTTPSYTDLTVSGSQVYYYAVSAIDTGQDASPLSASPAQVPTP